MEANLNATVRDTSRGKTGARKVRAAGQIPAIVYGPSHAAMAIQIDPYILSEIFRKSQNRNTVVYMALDGKTIPCLVREVQRHPLSRVIEHVDFYKVEADQKVRVEVPVVPTGKAKGISSGGRVQVVRRTVDVACAYDRIPATIEVDVSELDVNEYVRVSQLKAPADVTVVYSQDFPVVRVEGKQKERLEEAPAAGAAPAEGAAAAAPAAGAAAGKAPAKAPAKAKDKK